MLSTDQTMILLSLGVLMGRTEDVAPEVLSAFERDLVREVCARYLRDRADTTITEPEWGVIEQVIDTLRPIVRARVGAVEIEIGRIVLDVA